MQFYRFSPIINHDTLLEAIHHIHYACHTLCKKVTGISMDNNGNIAIFCHYDDEYERLMQWRKEMADGTTENPNQKYFPLHNPIVIPAKDDIPESTYTHLYIRKPDPYRHHVGDIDFLLPDDDYRTLKKIIADNPATGMRLFPVSNIDMIELYDSDSDVLAYISTLETGLSVRVTKTQPL